MQVPLPHRHFALGDTIPFTVTLQTNAQGQPWSPADAQACRIVILFTGPRGFSEEAEAAWVDESRCAYDWGTRRSQIKPGLYRYTVQAAPQLFGIGPHYTLLSGTLTLY